MEKEEFNKLFEALGTGDYVLLLSQREIKTNEDTYFANRVFVGKSFGVRYLFWHGAGSSANSYTKRDLHFIIDDLFKECKYYKLLTWKEYNNRVDQYFDDEFTMEDWEEEE